MTDARIEALAAAVEVRPGVRAVATGEAVDEAATDGTPGGGGAVEGTALRVVVSDPLAVYDVEDYIRALVSEFDTGRIVAEYEVDGGVTPDVADAVLGVDGARCPEDGTLAAAADGGETDEADEFSVVVDFPEAVGEVDAAVRAHAPFRRRGTTVTYSIAPATETTPSGGDH